MLYFSLPIFVLVGVLVDKIFHTVDAHFLIVAGLIAYLIGYILGDLHGLDRGKKGQIEEIEQWEKIKKAKKEEKRWLKSLLDKS